jgi:hypothetical protein
MNDFDRQLEIDLARMLDRVVRTPVPPRRGRRKSRPLLKLLSGSGAPTGQGPTLIVLSEKPAAGGGPLAPEVIAPAAAILSF